MNRRNNQTNNLIMFAVILGDFVLLNMVIYVFSKLNIKVGAWNWEQLRIFIISCNTALLISESFFHTRIHERMVSAGEVLKGILGLTLTQALITYVIMRHFLYLTAVGRVLLPMTSILFVLLVIVRLMEQSIIKKMRRMGRNTRTVTMVGTDMELRRVYEQLLLDPTTGYRVQGYYADEKLEDARVPWFGTIKGLMGDIRQGMEVKLGDDMYVCLSKKERETITQFICSSINKIGFRMSGTIEEYEEYLKSGRKFRPMAMQCLAAGALKPEENWFTVDRIKKIERFVIQFNYLSLFYAQK